MYSVEYNDVKWEVYQDDYYDESTRLEFSNFGEVKSYSKNFPEGRLIHGGLQEGYPIIRYKKMKTLDEKDKKHLETYQAEINQLRSEIKELKIPIRKKETPYEEFRKLERALKPKEEELAKLIKTLSKERAKINKKRAVYLHVLVHKAIAQLFLKNEDPELKKFVIHRNFDKQDNRLENLSWASKEEVVAHGLNSPKWVEHNLKLERKEVKRREHAKLSYADVVFIKRKLAKGEPMARLARRFGVSDMQIHRIKTGENWGDVKLSLTEEDKNNSNDVSQVQN